MFYRKVGKWLVTMSAAEQEVPTTTTSSSVCVCLGSSESVLCDICLSLFLVNFRSKCSSSSLCGHCQSSCLALGDDRWWVWEDHLRLRDHLPRRLRALLHDGERPRIWLTIFTMSPDWLPLASFNHNNVSHDSPYRTSTGRAPQW